MQILDNATQLAIDGLSVQAFALMLISANQPSVRIPGWAKKVREILNDNPEKMTLVNLANAVGIHAVTLSCRFSKVFGKSFGEYIREARDGRALILLQTTHMTVTE